jgi:hypothetical protein
MEDHHKLAIIAICAQHHSRQSHRSIICQFSDTDRWTTNDMPTSMCKLSLGAPMQHARVPLLLWGALSELSFGAHCQYLSFLQQEYLQVQTLQLACAVFAARFSALHEQQGGWKGISGLRLPGQGLQCSVAVTGFATDVAILLVTNAVLLTYAPRHLKACMGLLGSPLACTLTGRAMPLLAIKTNANRSNGIMILVNLKGVR